jgi:hypothetical protein
MAAETKWRLPRRLEDLGISSDAVLRQAGLPMSLFNQGKIWLDTEELFALFEAVQQISRDPVIGLKLGTNSRPEHYGPIAVAALHTRSFREAMHRIARYKRLTGPQEIRILDRRDEFGVEFVWLLAGTTEPSILVDMTMAWALSIGRRGTGREFNALRVEFTGPESRRRVYENHFGCPVEFGAKQNRIFFGIEEVNQPFVTYNPDLLELLVPQLEAELAQQLAAGSFKEQLKWTLKRFLVGRKPRLEDAAREMRVSVRTLRGQRQNDSPRQRRSSGNRRSERVFTLVARAGDEDLRNSLAESWRIEPNTPVYVIPYLGEPPAGLTKEKRRRWFRQDRSARVTADNVRMLVSRAKRTDRVGGRFEDLPSGLMD